MPASDLLSLRVIVLELVLELVLVAHLRRFMRGCQVPVHRSPVRRRLGLLQVPVCATLHRPPCRRVGPRARFQCQLHRCQVTRR